MNINQYSLKKILLIITFTMTLLAIVLNLNAVLTYLTMLLSILQPFIIGGCIAFILNIPVRFFDKILKKQIPQKMLRPISVLLTFISFVIIFNILIFVVVPELAKTFVTIGEAIDEFIPKFIIFAQEMIESPEISALLKDIQIDFSKVFTFLSDFLTSSVRNFLVSSFYATTSVVGVLVNILIAFIFSIYILFQKEKLQSQFTKLTYAIFNQKKSKQIIEVSSLTYRTFSNFITGQCLEAIILGAMFFVAMLVFRFPYALLVGVLIAFTALIPIVGAFIGCFVGAFLIFIQNPTQALMFIILFLVLQQIEGNLIYPVVVGNSVGLPSIWVLFAVTIGGSLMGVVGMLIFIPLTSIIYVLIGRWTNRRLKQKKIIIEN